MWLAATAVFTLTGVVLLLLDLATKGGSRHAAQHGWAGSLGHGAAPPAAPPAGGNATQGLHWFRPEGYELPPECVKHEDLYATVFDNLRPWFARGITRADLDACAPLATDDTFRGTPGGMQFRLLLWDGEAYITSGGLRRYIKDYSWFIQGLDYFMIPQIRDVARRWGLPPIDFALGFGDVGRIKGPEPNGALCPLLTYCKARTDYGILIPDGQFTQLMYDAWLERMAAEEDPVPWGEKEEKVVGRWHGYCSDAPALERGGGTERCIRAAYQNHTRDTEGRFTSFLPEFMTLSDQRRFKYTFSTDGLGCSNRLQKVLATGQVVVKQDSVLEEWFYGALRPWVHYVPSGWDGVTEIDRVVQFLRANDALAQAVGASGRRFALEHLNLEARQCYTKVLFEELAKLQRFTPRLEDYPHRLTYDQDVKTLEGESTPGMDTIETTRRRAARRRRE